MADPTERRKRDAARHREYRAKLRAAHADGALVVPLSQRCTLCREIKPAEDFARSVNTPSGLYSYCRPCDAVLQRERTQRARARDPEGYKLRCSARSRRYNHGMSDAAYRHLAETQGGCCAICGEAPEELCVDHDHVTGAVRGLLCLRCNTGIGMLNDDPARVEAALAYLAGDDAAGHALNSSSMPFTGQP
jgi:hypothetical protein